ncbi:hypothetical protein GCK72_022326 [Caenorhabditis remanei]|uniref:Uncharacterized protein n=1 Tax=Caenorhabditis remanei TaxID=31234 RepID=A0A6A5FTN4_CAERE|nr:hypothetical protein GCK72_022326 [Caenorhabditis remanei]KAF1745879.1 hypothetical protein GCK72_022326 [Caenorhabditis remanei]
MSSFQQKNSGAGNECGCNLEEKLKEIEKLRKTVNRLNNVLEIRNNDVKTTSKRCDNLRKECEDLKKMKKTPGEEDNLLVLEKNQMLEEKDDELYRLRKELHKKKYVVANIIPHHCKIVDKSRYFDGVVIRENITYSEKRKERNSTISSFNLLFSPTLGLIRAINKSGNKKTKLGKWYHFRVNDPRRKNNGGAPYTIDAATTKDPHRVRSLRGTEIIESQVVFLLHTTLDYGALYNEYFEDKCLNLILFSEALRLSIRNQLLFKHGEVKLSMKIKLREDYEELFRYDHTRPLFEVISVTVDNTFY